MRKLKISKALNIAVGCVMASYLDANENRQHIREQHIQVIGGNGMNDKEQEEFVCEYCGVELDETDEYHTTFRTCNEDCYMKMVGLSWSDFI